MATFELGTDKGERNYVVSIKIGTYNIRSGRAGNLEGYLRAMHKMHMDIGILTEMRLTDERHAKRAFCYDVVATKAISPHQGGIALIYRTSEYWQVESVRCHGPNVIGFQLVTGERRYSCVGGYIPPSDVSTIQYVGQAFDRLPTGRRIFLGDLNVDLNNLRDDRATRVATMTAGLGLENLLSHFRQRRRHKGGFTWHVRRNDKIITARCDYILGSCIETWLRGPFCLGQGRRTNPIPDGEKKFLCGRAESVHKRRQTVCSMSANPLQLG
jgi:hypothetical protein